MRILHVTESHEAQAGGVTTVVNDLATYLIGSGADVGIFSVGEHPVPPPSAVAAWNCAPHPRLARWGWHPNLRERLRKTIRDFSPTVIHLHGAWLAPQILGARTAMKRGIPFIMSFHGMLEPYHWSDRGLIQLLRKRSYWSVASRSFSHAVAVHAITPLEAQHLTRWLPQVEIIVIPNAVDLSLVSRRVDQMANGGIERRIRFLGRLHPKKGVDLLIHAFGSASLSGEWQLDIAGPDWDSNYTQHLKSIAQKSPAAARVHFLGPLFGDERLDYLRRSWVVAVPSLSEVVGIVNLEAGACKTPTITSRETGLDDWPEGGGCLVDLDVGGIARALEHYTRLSEGVRKQKGVESLELVRKRYSWTAVGPRWLALYERATRRRVANAVP